MNNHSDKSTAKPISNEEPDTGPDYKAPAEKSIDEIGEQDADDEALVRYKDALLAGGQDPGSTGGSNVIVEHMALVVDGRDDIVLDLTGDLSQLKEQTIVFKEGTEYKIRIGFRVNHRIVSGLRYHHALSRKGVSVDKKSYMVGSYGPNANTQSYLCPADEAPKGMMARGHYKIKSKFVDDDKNIHLQWEWSMDIKKDWD